MPTYEYECEACGAHHEEFQSMSAAPLKKCPACKKNKLTRLIGSGAGIIFKGSGFYETDYKRSGSGSSAGDKPASSASEKKSDAPAATPAPAAPATPATPSK